VTQFEPVVVRDVTLALRGSVLGGVSVVFFHKIMVTQIFITIIHFLGTYGTTEVWGECHGKLGLEDGRLLVKVPSATSKFWVILSQTNGC
jgi:hypothetical protein